MRVLLRDRLARTLLVVLVTAFAGCAAVPRPGPTALERADQQMASGNYRVAINLYDGFLRTASHDPEARRVAATRAALGQLLRVETVAQELEQQARQREDELAEAQRELVALREEVQRARRELDSLRLVDVKREKLQSKVTLCEAALGRLQYRMQAVQAETSRVRENLEQLKLIDLTLEQRVR